MSKIKEAANTVGKDAGTKAGTEAGSNIDIGNIISEVMKAAKKAAQEQAFEMKAFDTMNANCANGYCIATSVLVPTSKIFQKTFCMNHSSRVLSLCL